MKNNIRIVLTLLFSISFLSYLLPQVQSNNKSAFKKSTSDSVLTVVGRWGWGACNTFDADSQYAYIGNGAEIQVIDLSDPANPKLIGQYTSNGLVEDIKIEGNKAYVCIGLGLLILDISNPYQISKLGFFAIPNGADRLIVKPNIAYVLAANGFLWGIDISDPSKPYVRNYNSVSWPFIVGQMVSKDNLLYLTNPESVGIDLINISNPDSLTDTFFPEARIVAIYVADTLLFLNGDGISIYSIADAANPVFLSRTYPSIDIISFIKIDSILYAKSSGNTIERFNTSNPYSPIAIDTININDPEPTGMLLNHNNYFLTNNAYCFQTIQMINGDSLVANGFFPTGYQVTKVRIKDNLAFIASAYAGVWIVDVSDPAYPTNLVNINPGGYVNDFFEDDSLLYIACANDYVYMVDIRNISNPKLINEYHTEFEPQAMAFNTNRVFVAEYSYSDTNRAIEILNRNDLSIWQNLTTFRPFYPVANDSLFIFQDALSSQTKLFKVEAQSLSEISTINKMGEGMFLKDTLLYIFEDSLSVFDISIPSIPNLISKSFLQNTVAADYDIVNQGDTLYWGNYKIGLTNISNFSNIKSQIIYQDPRYVIGNTLDVKGDMLYAGAGFEGVWFFKVNRVTDIKTAANNSPNAFQLYQNYPNPFNPTTTINYSVPKASLVTIKVYDILGREITTLVNEQKRPGNYNVQFNGNRLASGVYFYRMQAGDFMQTKKLVLMK